MNPAHVLDVGNCGADHDAIRSFLERGFDVRVSSVMFAHEALAALRCARYDLVLVNRLIFADNSDGMELVRAVRADPELRATPIMLVSNYPDAQAAAVAAGALPGFGKAALGTAETIARLAQVLPRRSATHAAREKAGSSN
jgi:CheY-like chemotaxis protein